jgi:TatD DNase family protein
MTIIDTHCHYNMDELWSDWRQHWQRAQAAGVTDSVVVGTSLETSQRSLELAQHDDHLHSCVGIHPYRYTELIQENPTISQAEIIEAIEADYAQLLEMATQAGRPLVAVGETGLDYFRLDPTRQWDQTLVAQRQGFIAHLKLAAELDVPVIIHVRDMGPQAYTDVLDILKEHYHGTQPFILHCVSGSVEYVQAALELGAYIGMAGNITYKNANLIRSLARISPPDRLLLETDAPFLPPHPHRGQQCEPWMISLTAAFVQEELGFDLDHISKNARRVFGLK